MKSKSRIILLIVFLLSIVHTGYADDLQRLANTLKCPDVVLGVSKGCSNKNEARNKAIANAIIMYAINSPETSLTSLITNKSKEVGGGTSVEIVHACETIVLDNFSVKLIDECLHKTGEYFVSCQIESNKATGNALIFRRTTGIQYSQNVNGDIQVEAALRLNGNAIDVKLNMSIEAGHYLLNDRNAIILDSHTSTTANYPEITFRTKEIEDKNNFMLSECQSLFSIQSLVFCTLPLVCSKYGIETYEELYEAERNTTYRFVGNDKLHPMGFYVLSIKDNKIVCGLAGDRLPVKTNLNRQRFFEYEYTPYSGLLLWEKANAFYEALVIYTVNSPRQTNKTLTSIEASDFLIDWRASVPNHLILYSIYDTKGFHDLCQIKIDSTITQWAQRQPGEFTQNWKYRTSPANKKRYIDSLTIAMRQQYIESNKPTNISAKVGEYDPQSKILSIDFQNLNSIAINIPPADAAMLQKQWNKVKLTPDYGVVDDVVGIAECAITLNGKTYKTSGYKDGFDGNDFIIQLQEDKNNCLLDIDIPIANQANPNVFAVIIGNENYQKVLPVEYANNDASIFAKYCQKTLGLPLENIRYYADATYGTMLAALKDIKSIAEAYNGNIDIIFYYAGHGIPDGTGSAYLLPVDADGTQTEVCLSTSRLYQELNSLNTRHTVVFLDACFSGARRGDGMLMAARGVAIKPKNNIINGNLVVFSAAQGTETAYPYAEMGHGMFTYYVLKKLQETKGEVSLGELGEYVTSAVSQKSIVINRKSQTPATATSSSLGNEWKSWKLK